MPVTEEQRVRMEQKRAEALAKVKSRQGTLSHSAASTHQNNATPNPAIRAPFAPPRDQVPLNPGIRAQFVPPFRVPLNANPSSLSTGSRVSLNATSSTGIRVPLNPTPNSSSAGIRVPLNSTPNSSSAGIRVPLNSTPSSSSGGIKVPLVPLKTHDVPSSAQQKQPQKMISNGLYLVPHNSSSFSNSSNQFPPHKPVTASRGLTEEQKITMENKRTAALAKKQGLLKINSTRSSIGRGDGSSIVRGDGSFLRKLMERNLEQEKQLCIEEGRKICTPSQNNSNNPEKSPDKSVPIHVQSAESPTG